MTRPISRSGEVVGALRSGMAPSEVAAEMGMSVDDVRRVAVMAGLTSWVWKAAFEARIVAEYVAGRPSTEIAKFHGCSTQKVLNAVRRAGLSIRPPERKAGASPLSESARAALAMVGRGASNAAAARATGLSRERVRQIVSRYASGS